jgi:hypothetical protein
VYVRTSFLEAGDLRRPDVERIILLTLLTSLVAATSEVSKVSLHCQILNLRCIRKRFTRRRFSILKHQ